jgi:hypothetical protein
MLSGLLYALNKSDPIKLRLGKKVLSDRLSLRDDPTYPEYGYYEFDAEGVRAQAVDLVVDGILKGFLLDRYSARLLGQKQKIVMKSNGHARVGDVNDIKKREDAAHQDDFDDDPLNIWPLDPEPRQSNLIVSAKGPERDEELERRAIELAREKGVEYALLAKDYRRGGVNTGSGNVRLYPYMVIAIDVKTGERIVVQQPFLNCDVQAAFTQGFVQGVGHGPKWTRGVCGADSGYVPIATRCPPMLFDSMSLTSKTEDKYNPRLTPPNGSS